jgi:hypothetical protein
MIDTRVHYVIHDSTGAIRAVGFCDRLVLKARISSLTSGQSLLAVDAATWQSVRFSPSAFKVSAGAVIPLGSKPSGAGAGAATASNAATSSPPA